MLAHTERIVLLDDTMFISCGTGNGWAFRRRGALAEQFRRDLGMSWTELVDRMPSDACFTSALVLNDLMRLKDQLPHRFAGCEIDHVQYYLGCLFDYSRAARQGADLSEDYDALIDGLNREPQDVQNTVRQYQLYLQSVAILPPETGRTDGEAVDDSDDAAESRGPTFDSVFEAMAWAAENPCPLREVDGEDESPIPMPRLDAYRRLSMRRKSRPLIGDAHIAAGMS
jgi:hypothetical protein